ncbi:MAG: hypothetical protein WC758_07800 [Candidatus Woesearchaeota archaeon]|jgi:hypothetical protein
MNKKILWSLGIAIPALTALVLSKAIVQPEVNLFSTGLTPNTLIIVGQIFLLWAIFKKHI